MSPKDKTENVEEQKLFFTDEKLASLLQKLEAENKNYTSLGLEIGNLTDNRNKAYGNSFDDTSKILEIFYPNGLPPEKFSDAVFTVRIFDKLKRIANNKNAFNENPYSDLLGITLRMAVANSKPEEGK